MRCCASTWYALRMSRPKRTARVYLVVRPDEKDAWQAAAAERDMTVSDFIRRSIAWTMEQSGAT